jgi:hypothetical protein
MSRSLRVALLILLQGLGSALAAAPTVAPQTMTVMKAEPGEHAAMPCHDDAERAAAMPCCDEDQACRCTAACFGGSAPLPRGITSMALPPLRPATTASPPAPLPAHPHPPLRPPASAVS